MDLTAERVLMASKGLLSIITNNRAMAPGARFKVARLFATIKREVELIEEQQKLLCEEHGTASPEDGPGTYRFENGGREAYTVAWDAVASTIITVDVLPLSLKECGDDCAIDVTEMVLLGDLMEE
tara:strand:+ start:3724 stop:4098 length:375 start_codon:yes stop_codon:yes gene_type:complete